MKRTRFSLVRDITDGFMAIAVNFDREPPRPVGIATDKWVGVVGCRLSNEFLPEFVALIESRGSKVGKASTAVEVSNIAIEVAGTPCTLSVDVTAYAEVLEGDLQRMLKAHIEEAISAKPLAMLPVSNVFVVHDEGVLVVSKRDHEDIEHLVHPTHELPPDEQEEVSAIDALLEDFKDEGVDVHEALTLAALTPSAH